MNTHPRSRAAPPGAGPLRRACAAAALVFLAVLVALVAIASGADQRVMASLDGDAATVHAPASSGHRLAVGAFDLDDDQPEDEAWDDLGEPTLPSTSSGDVRVTRVEPATGVVAGRALHERLFRPPRA